MPFVIDMVYKSRHVSTLTNKPEADGVSVKRASYFPIIGFTFSKLVSQA